ncbi:MAG: hypothetical protein ACHBNF_13920 [Chromatiales bacterium]
MSEIKATIIRFAAAVPQFTVPELVRTAEYYRDVLGFQIAGYWDGERFSLDADAPPVFAIVRRDEVQIFFNRADQSDVRTGRAQGAYDAYLRVTGLTRLRRSCPHAVPTSSTVPKTGSTGSVSS